MSTTYSFLQKECKCKMDQLQIRGIEQIKRQFRDNFGIFRNHNARNMINITNKFRPVLRSLWKEEEISNNRRATLRKHNV